MEMKIFLKVELVRVFELSGYTVFFLFYFCVRLIYLFGYSNLYIRDEYEFNLDLVNGVVRGGILGSLGF